MRKKIGECLIQSGLITDQDLQVALEEHKRTGERVGAVLVRLNLATEKQITKALAYQLGFPYVSLSDDPPERSAIVLIPKAVALKRLCVAVRLEKNLLTVAMSDPLLSSLVQDLEFQTGYPIKQVIAMRSDILESIESGYPDKTITRDTWSGTDGGLPIQVRPEGFVPPDPPSNPTAHTTRGGGPGSPSLAGGSSPLSASASAEATADAPDRVAAGDQPAPSEDALSGVLMRGNDDSVFEQAADGSVREESDSPSIIDLVDLVVKNAFSSGASGVHIEPTDSGVLVRHRLDGLLKEVMDLPKRVHGGLVDRLKIMAGLDITETHVPQDGRVRIGTGDGQTVDLRVSTLRTLTGETIVLRVLDHHRAVPPLEELGLSAAAMEEVRSFLRHQHGMILVVGPTGSGKTTTLSSAISSIKSSRISIVTIEDPIEYQIQGVNQTQVGDEAQLTFASALRAVLRQDPDVVLISEMRDEETARIAMHAAQAGQLVLSTLPTDNAPSTVTRLADMAIEPYVTGSALIGVIAQRLVRRLCVACRRQHTPETETLRALSIPEAGADQFVFYKSVGCDECHQTGYRGRIALYEVMRVSDKMRRLMAHKAGEDLIREAAVEGGMISLGEDGLAKVKAGITSAEELLRVVADVREMRKLCPGCGGPVAIDFNTCPHCAHPLSHGCPRCSRAIQPGWTFCPYCSANTVPKKKKNKEGKERKTLELPSSNVAEFKNQNR